MTDASVAQTTDQTTGRGPRPGGRLPAAGARGVAAPRRRRAQQGPRRRRPPRRAAGRGRPAPPPRGWPRGRRPLPARGPRPRCPGRDAVHPRPRPARRDDPVGRAPAARRPRPRRDPGRRARRPRARRHLRVGAPGRRRHRRGRPARRCSPTCASTSPRSSSRRSPTSPARPAPCSTSSPTASRSAATSASTRSARPPGSAPPPTSHPLADLVRECAHRDGWRAITVDARVLHEAGATDVDALAVAVATGVEYLRHLEAAGIPANRGVRPDRPARRRHRRPVPHRGRAACRAPGLGPGRRGLRRGRGPARGAHPRGHQPADVHPRGPVGQRAAQHPGRVRRLGRRCRLDHRAALRHRARPARAARPPAGPQHPDPARRRVQRRPGHRPRRRLLVPRVPHRPGGGCRVVPFPGGRARRRCRAGARRRAAAPLGRAGVHRARPPDRHPPAPAHRGVDVPA